MVKAVIFDAGGVLHPGNKAISADIAQELGLSQETIDHIWQTHIPLLGSGKIDEEGFWRQVQTEHGTREVSVSENLLGRSLSDIISPMPGVFEILAKLKQLGLTLAVLSDTIEPHARVLEAKGLYEPFEYRFLSHETGLRKPAAETFRKVLNKLGLQPAEAVFVDDDPTNVAAAQAMGINSLVFTSSEQLETDLRRLIPTFDQDTTPGS